MTLFFIDALVQKNIIPPYRHTHVEDVRCAYFTFTGYKNKVFLNITLIFLLGKFIIKVVKTFLNVMYFTLCPKILLALAVLVLLLYLISVKEIMDATLMRSTNTKESLKLQLLVHKISATWLELSFSVH